jgi:hypothetical protein
LLDNLKIGVWFLNDHFHFLLATSATLTFINSMLKGLISGGDYLVFIFEMNGHISKNQARVVSKTHLEPPASSHSLPFLPLGF